MNLIFDSHLDLSYNALSYERDQTLSLQALRQREAHMTEHDRRFVTVSLPEMRKAGVAVCLATLLARGQASRVFPQTPLRTALDYGDQTIAYAVARGQAAYYELLESRGQMRMIRDAATLDSHWKSWAGKRRGKPPIGYILSMEGCDPIVTPDQAQEWWDRGLRTAMMAHYGPSAYSYGTGGDGPLTRAGRKLLKEFDRLGMILDLTHTAETAWHQAIDLFGGPVFASHNNCRALVPGDRQFSDEQVRLLVKRGGVIGTVLDAWMLYPNYKAGKTKRSLIGLSAVVDHIDHVCQIAGNARHAAIGSDLDGGYSANQCPQGIDSIADLHKFAPLLSDRGYSDDDIARIFHRNWLEFFRRSLPARP